MVTCRYCGKEIAPFNWTFKKMKLRLRSYDMYWFCKKGDCVDNYIKNGEKSLVEHE
jgi:hypothetical protein